MPRRHRALHDRLRALVQAPEQACAGGDDDEGDQNCARFAAGDGGFEAVVGGQIEAGGFFVFCRVALHHGDGIQHLSGDGA